MPLVCVHKMKLKNSGSISDSEHLNFPETDEEETEQLQSHLPSLSNIYTAKELEDVTKVTIFSTSPPTSPNQSDPANHDKIYYDDRYNESVFDPLLARSSLPKIVISIAGMLLTGFFLNTILVSYIIIVCL